MEIAKKYCALEEVLSSSIHGFGAFLGGIELTVLVTLSSVYGNAWNIVSTAIFGASIILLYTASSLYHGIPFEKAKRVLEKIDHIAIYYLIAGSYTPFLLANMRNATGWTMFGIIWGLAILGTFLKIFIGANGSKLWSILLYLAMGWLIIFASGTLFKILSASAITFLCLGGAFYTFGVIFYVKKNKKYMHAIWHLFVLLGTIMHFFAVLFSCVVAK
ncbi:MAG: hemolysin III family protein [Opitutales bacterium]|nr:hemolysin III family protein [Opitutales bacterium]